MFSPETLDFLATNRFMNSREWYAEHKPDFKQYVLQPMIDLVEALTPTLESIDDRIVTEPKVDKTISRIYRDMRRAHGAFYREVMWLTFKRDKRMFPGYPEFFFVFNNFYPRKLICSFPILRGFFCSFSKIKRKLSIKVTLKTI